MNVEAREQLRAAAAAALQATARPRASEAAVVALPKVHERWVIQTSNSFRRIGCHGDGDVLCATTQRSDGQPDLRAAAGVLDYIVATQPHVLLDLLDYVDALERGGPR